MAQGGSEPGQRQRKYAGRQELRQSAEKDFKSRITACLGKSEDYSRQGI